jgi:hypothetical protein
MAFFEKKQSRKFQRTDDGFVYKGTHHALSEIQHLFFNRVVTTQRMNFVKMGEAESALLLVTLRDGQKIKLSFDEAGLFMGFNSNKKDDIQFLIDLYLDFANKTFQQRAEQYLTQVQYTGYFVYDGCKFYPRDKIVFKDKEFPIQSSSFLKSYGYIEMRPKDYGLMNKVLREVTFTKIPQFNTQTDSDVIFYILDEHFGLKWS